MKLQYLSKLSDILQIFKNSVESLEGITLLRLFMSDYPKNVPVKKPTSRSLSR